jgi:DNA (cytosine-5)-methyltransferase 1
VQVDSVERYVVVHGQIILNQFRDYPKREVKNCSFVGALKERMQHRRHCKLYISKKALKAIRGVNRNPMKVQSVSIFLVVL